MAGLQSQTYESVVGQWLKDAVGGADADAAGHLRVAQKPALTTQLQPAFHLPDMPLGFTYPLMCDSCHEAGTSWTKAGGGYDVHFFKDKNGAFVKIQDMSFW